MELTAERIARFAGGDMEIQNPGEDYLFRGPVETATVEGGEVRVRFKWLAKNDGGPSNPTPTWTKDDRPDYAASLEIYAVSDIGDGRICLNSSIVGETVVLFPPGGSRLDPSRVKGLEAVNYETRPQPFSRSIENKPTRVGFLNSNELDHTL